MAMTLGRRARVLRERLGMTQTQAASRAGMSQATWSRVENDTKRATAGELLAMSWALGVPLTIMRGRSAIRDTVAVASRTVPTSAVDVDLLDAVDEQLVAIIEVAADLEDHGFLPARG